MMPLIEHIVEFGGNAYGVFIIGYFILVNVFYFAMFIVSFGAIVHSLHRNLFTRHRVIMQSEFSTPISIVASGVQRIGNMCPKHAIPA